MRFKYERVCLSVTVGLGVRYMHVYACSYAMPFGMEASVLFHFDCFDLSLLFRSKRNPSFEKACLTDYLLECARRTNTE